MWKRFFFPWPKTLCGKLSQPACPVPWKKGLLPDLGLLRQRRFALFLSLTFFDNPVFMISPFANFTWSSTLSSVYYSCCGRACLLVTAYGEVTVARSLLLLLSFNKALSVRYGFSLNTVSRQFANKWVSCFQMLRILIMHYLIKF